MAMIKFDPKKDFANYCNNQSILIRLMVSLGDIKSPDEWIEVYAMRYRALYRLYGKVTRDMLI